MSEKYFSSKLKKLWFHLNRLTCTLHFLLYLQEKIQEGNGWNIFLCFANFLITLLSLSNLDMLYILQEWKVSIPKYFDVHTKLQHDNRKIMIIGKQKF